jgi:hypothetical protein
VISYLVAASSNPALGTSLSFKKKGLCQTPKGIENRNNIYIQRIHNKGMELKPISNKGNLSFLILLAGIIFISGCIFPDVGENETIPPEPEPNITVNLTENITANITETANVSYEVNISSLTCEWTVKIGEYNVKSDCVRIISAGTAQGPVGSRVELPILAWSDDNFDCGNWTHRTGALIAVGHTCVRQEGQAETTNWTVDTGGDNCPIKNYFGNNRYYSVKIYKNNEIFSENEDNRTVQCA